MPIVTVNFLEGRTLEQKRALAESITKAIMDSLKVPADSVSIILREMKREDFSKGGVLRCDKNNPNVKL